MNSYGYARISTTRQSIDRQIRNLQAACLSALIVTETYTGTKLDRKEWQKLMRTVRTGDVILFDSVSRNTFYKYKRELKEQGRE